MDKEIFMYQLQWIECGFWNIVLRYNVIPFLASAVKITMDSKFDIGIR